MKTRDGVEVDPLGKYWRIPVFEEYDFSGIHKGKLPKHQARNASFQVVGSDLMDGQMYESAERFASTEHLANYYGFVDLMERIKEEERGLECEIKKLQRRREKVNQRLGQWLEQQEG